MLKDDWYSVVGEWEILLYCHAKMQIIYICNGESEIYLPKVSN